MRRLLLALLTHAVTGAAVQTQGWEEPDMRSYDEDAAMPPMSPPEASSTELDQLIERHRAQLVAIPTVVGVGSGRTASGPVAVIIWATEGRAAEPLPDRIDRYPVELVVVPGGFRAY